MKRKDRDFNKINEAKNKKRKQTQIDNEDDDDDVIGSIFVSITLAQPNNRLILNYLRTTVDKLTPKTYTLKENAKKEFYFKDDKFGSPRTIFLINKKVVNVSKTSTYLSGDTTYNENIPIVDSVYLNNHLPFMGTIRSVDPLEVKRQKNIVFTHFNLICNGKVIIFKNIFIKLVQNGSKKSKIGQTQSFILLPQSDKGDSDKGIKLGDLKHRNIELVLCEKGGVQKTFQRMTRGSLFFINWSKERDGILTLEKPQFNFKNFCINYSGENNNNVLNSGNSAVKFFFMNFQAYIKGHEDGTLTQLEQQIKKFDHGKNPDAFLYLKSFIIQSELIKKHVPVCLDLNFITGVAFEKIMTGFLSTVAELNVVKNVLKNELLIPTSINRYTGDVSIKRFQKKIKNGFFWIGDQSSKKKIVGFDLGSAFASSFCKKYMNDKSPMRKTLFDILMPLLKRKRTVENATPYKLLINITYGNTKNKYLRYLQPNKTLLKNFTDACVEEMENIQSELNQNLRSRGFELIYGMTDSMYFLADVDKFERVMNSVTDNLPKILKLKQEGPWNYGIIFSYNNYIFQRGKEFDSRVDVAKGKFFCSSTVPKTIRSFCFAFVNLFFTRGGGGGSLIPKNEFYELLESHINKTPVTYDNFLISQKFSFKNDVHGMIKMNNDIYKTDRDRVFLVDVRENGFTRTECLGECIKKELKIDYNYVYENYKLQLYNFLKCLINET